MCTGLKIGPNTGNLVSIIYQKLQCDLKRLAVHEMHDSRFRIA